MSRDCIIARLEAAFEKARFRKLEVTWIYLTADDWTDFDQAKSEEWGSKVHCFSFNDVQIRSGERSRLFSKYGESVGIPKLLSAKVAA